jgi:hypothetical protein
MSEIKILPQKTGDYNIDYLRWLEEWFCVDFDKPSNGTIYTHKNVWRDNYNSFNIRKGYRNYIIDFDNDRRIYICFLWNLEEYMKKCCVPEKYHSILRTIRSKKD